MSDLFQQAPEPPTALGRYRVLSKTAGIKVSPLQLGAMSLGDAWSSTMGPMSKENSFKLLDAFVEAGGNFIDTSNNYQDEQSETWIGEWMKQRHNRDLLVVATKFSTAYTSYRQGKGKTVNYAGNHKRALKMSVRDSLAKLQTDWIDLLYVHWWEWTTSIEEVMDSLHELVLQGKVLYLGVSDTPAYIVAAANTYAKAHGKTQFSVYQGRKCSPRPPFVHTSQLTGSDQDGTSWSEIWSARSFPCAATSAWPLRPGTPSKRTVEERIKNNEPLRSFLTPTEQSEQEVRASAALEDVAREHNLTSLTAVALAYVMSKAPYVFPLVGGRKVEHLKDNIQSLTIKLTSEQLDKLDAVAGFQPEFPYNLIGEDPAVTGKAGMIVGAVAPMSFVKNQMPIGHE
nr:putative aryl-alcohol dehydrogenase aad14 [Quercus suber]